MTRRFKDISGPDMAVWCEMLADDNAIHLSRYAAQAAGFGPRRVNPGPANLACLMSLVGEDIAHVDARFSGNVFEGDDLTAEVTSHTTTETETRLIRDADGGTVVTATFTRSKDKS
ncbi:MaoC family dehydratase [Maritimibacter sp. DP1N21-5]|uniref:MaoC family dehydratase n=1 Tax=Maritimibacter sp. DP1N21-5 TaxID=2836867 RepID=UPI001C43C187|nr:MaoC family dehydratase [Maritimibacter sp. DP1N21-5]MBV7407443.1 MaoC family dehydratase [Maritimibacter sp. DP1N21-5]